MNILVIGSGGREHALAWKLAQSPRVERVFIAPGNAGTTNLGQNIDIAADSIDKLAQFAKDNNIDLVVPGPELPLTLGITDAMANAGIACFGPDKFCARIEGSKSFAKQLMHEAGVPTAKAMTFTDAAEAKKYVLAGPDEIVIKADGLAAGKGVVVASSHDEAIAAINEIMTNGQFGQAGATIVIEEKLNGEEVSLLCLCDGEHAVPLPSAQDHKAAFDHDQGPNTGGMGAYSPAPLLPDEQLETMADLVIRPILAALARKGHPYKGVLYAGLMLTSDGPKVLEYNARFGDPECQPIMLRLKSDLASHLAAACEGRLDQENIMFNPASALGVVLAANGYPGKYAKDQPITGIEKAEEDKNTVVFHSGVKEADGKLLSSGGRVLCVTSLGHTLSQAQAAAYDAVSKIHMPKSRFRRDIGLKGIMRLKSQTC